MLLNIEHYRHLCSKFTKNITLLKITRGETCINVPINVVIEEQNLEKSKGKASPRRQSVKSQFDSWNDTDLLGNKETRHKRFCDKSDDQQKEIFQEMKVMRKELPAYPIG